MFSVCLLHGRKIGTFLSLDPIRNGGGGGVVESPLYVSGLHGNWNSLLSLHIVYKGLAYLTVI